MKKNFKYFLIIGSILLGYKFNSQTSFQKKLFVVNNDIFGINYFQENKGQYDSVPCKGEPILYALDNGFDKVYFTKKGLIYELRKTFPLSAKQREAVEEGKNVQQKKDEVHYVSMTWLGANYSNIELEATDKQSHYITYGEEKNNSHTFKKLVYKNVYNKIDIEYKIPEDNKHGIKYSIILNQGADINQFKILYGGDIKKIKIKDGKVLVKTTLNMIVEEAPLTYYENYEIVKSVFQIQDSTITFNFPEGINPNKKIIVDPWVGSITTLSNSSVASNFGYDVDYDFVGNLYVFGGATTGSINTKVACYNNTGVLLWTFSGQVNSIGWQSNGGYISSFVVDRYLSKCYVSQGVAYVPNTIVRLDANGNYDNFITAPNVLYQEVWDIGFDCFTNNVITFGGGHTSNTCAAKINTVTGVLTLASFHPTNTSFGHDISSSAINDNGNLFVYYACSGLLNHKICLVNPTFNGNVWTQPSGFSNLAEVHNKNSYANLTSGLGSGGFNALSANNNFLFYYDGANLAAYSITTGTLVAATFVPGYAPKRQGGIAVDECNNIYVGGIGVINTFSFNGTSFSTLTPIFLNTIGTNQYVCDIKLNKNTKTLFVSGTGFIGTYSASLSQNCASALTACLFNQPGLTALSSSITCASLGSATAIINGTGVYSYTWLPINQTGSVVSNLSPGTYTVLVLDNGTNTTYTTTTTFVSPVPLTATISASLLLACNGYSNGAASISAISGGSGNQTYTWTSVNGISNSSSISAIGAGNYTVSIKDALTSCVYMQTFTILQPSPVGAFITISSATACVGNNITLSGFGFGGNPSYTYNWTNGPPGTSFVVNENISGSHIYTLNVTDTNFCSGYNTVSVTFVPKPILGLSNVSICPLETATLVVNAATNYTWFASNASSIILSSQNSLTVSPIINQQFVVGASALGCTSIDSAYVFVKPLPVPVFISNSPVCEGKQLTLSCNSGTAYVWSGPNAFVSAMASNSINPVTLTANGVYNVTVAALNSCTAATSGTVIIQPLPTVTIAPSTQSLCINLQTVSLYASGTATLFNWLPNQSISGTFGASVFAHPNITKTYTAIGSLNNCTNIATAIVYVIQPPNLNLGLSSNSFCAQALNGSANTITLTSSGASSYTLGTPVQFNNPNPSGPSSPVNLNPPFSLSGPATATLFGSNGVCTVSTSVVFTVVPNPSIAINNAAPIICVGETFTFTNSGASSYLWSSASPGSTLYATANVAVANPTTSSVFSVFGSSLGCNSAMQTTTITVKPLPFVYVSPNTTFVCLGNSTKLIAEGNGSSFIWSSVASSNFNMGQFVMVAPVKQETYTVVASLNNCTNSAMVTVSVMQLPKPTIISNKTILCLNQELILEGSGAKIYNWRSPNNLAYTGQSIKIPMFNLTYAGIYSLAAIDSNACEGRTVTNISLLDLPTGYLKSNQTYFCVPFCSAYQFVLNQKTTNNIASFSWKLNNQFVSSANNFSYCFTNAGDYQIKGDVQADNGCANSILLNVTAYPKPKAGFSYSPDKPIENVDEVEFVADGNGIKEFTWTMKVASDKWLELSGNTVKKIFDNAGLYPIVLVVTNEFNCMDTVIKPITILLDLAVYVPNAFTPNGNGHNETFMPVISAAQSIHFEVYDRWGEKVFETSELNTGWDGTFRGQVCKQDVYVWRLTVKGLTGEAKGVTAEKNYTGEVMLYR